MTSESRPDDEKELAIGRAVASTKQTSRSRKSLVNNRPAPRQMADDREENTRSVDRVSSPPCLRNSTAYTVGGEAKATRDLKATQAIPD